MKPPARSLSASLAPVLLGIGMIGALSASLHRPESVPAPIEWSAAALAGQSFRQMMAQAMSQMTRDAMGAPMGRSPDADFASMMIVHHLGAIEMAKAELLHGQDPILRRLAQEIVVTQGAEIAVMRGQLSAAAELCRSPN